MKALVRQGAKRYLVARCARAYDPSGPQQYYEFMFSKELVPVADEVFPRMYTHESHAMLVRGRTPEGYSYSTGCRSRWNHTHRAWQMLNLLECRRSHKPQLPTTDRSLSTQLEAIEDALVAHLMAHQQSSRQPSQRLPALSTLGWLELHLLVSFCRKPV